MNRMNAEFHKVLKYANVRGHRRGTAACPNRWRSAAATKRHQ